MPSDTRLPTIKHTPPMVGVPFFLACQLGPSLVLMVCPQCSLRISGTQKQPVTAEIRKPSTDASANIVFAIISPHLFQKCLQQHCFCRLAHRWLLPFALPGIRAAQGFPDHGTQH